MSIETLSIEDVLQIHEFLVEDFAESGDPISPPGTRSLDLLASAVFRQDTSIGNTLKYPDPIGNAATLAYGLCNDRPFYNGNKRTALVAMLVHLDKNRLALFETSQQDLYEMILGVADHTLGIRTDPRKQHLEPYHRSSDLNNGERCRENWVPACIACDTVKGECFPWEYDSRRFLQGDENPDNYIIKKKDPTSPA